MPREQYVTIYSARAGDEFEVEASTLRQTAQQELGMTDGPVELNIFTKTILATALQREQIARNEALKAAMTEGGDWKAAMQHVAAVTELMEKFGIDDANWSPTAASLTAPSEAPKPEAPAVKGQQTGLNLDGQEEIGF